MWGLGAIVTVLQGMHISAQHFARYDDSYTWQKAINCCQSTRLFTVGMHPRSEHVGPRPSRTFRTVMQRRMQDRSACTLTEIADITIVTPFLQNQAYYRLASTTSLQQQQRSHRNQLGGTQPDEPAKPQGHLTNYITCTRNVFVAIAGRHTF